MYGEAILPCWAWEFTPVKYFESAVKPPQRPGVTTLSRRSRARRGMENEQGSDGSGTTVIGVASNRNQDYS